MSVQYQPRESYMIPDFGVGGMGPGIHLKRKDSEALSSTAGLGERSHGENFVEVGARGRRRGRPGSSSEVRLLP